MTRSFLIANVDDERARVSVFSKAAPFGEPSVEEVQALARRHGYEIKPEGVRRSFEEKRAWPLTIRAYTSRDRGGRGRTGSSVHGFPARRIPCTRCHGRGYEHVTIASYGGLGASLQIGPTCHPCKGTGLTLKRSR